MEEKLQWKGSFFYETCRKRFSTIFTQFYKLTMNFTLGRNTPQIHRVVQIKKDLEDKNIFYTFDKIWHVVLPLFYFLILKSYLVDRFFICIYRIWQIWLSFFILVAQGQQMCFTNCTKSSSHNKTVAKEMAYQRKCN